MVEVAYEAAVKVYAFYGALFKEIVNELGEGKALTLHKNAHEYIGLKTGKQIQNQMGATDYDLETLSKVLKKGNQSIGIDCQMIKSIDSILLRN